MLVGICSLWYISRFRELRGTDSGVYGTSWIRSRISGFSYPSLFV